MQILHSKLMICVTKLMICVTGWDLAAALAVVLMGYLIGGAVYVYILKQMISHENMTISR